jgi:spore germination protein PD
MFFTVINEGLQIEKIKIKSLAVSSTLFIGDAKSVSLASWFDTPAEKVIVGVTIGVTETENTQD